MNQSAATSLDTLTIILPDDWHCHFRDGDALALTVPHAAARFGRAIAMPNLTPPVVTVDMARAYRERILDALARYGEPAQQSFEPLMTLYLTDRTSAAEIERAKQCGFVHAVKLYPAGATTNSDAGVTDLSALGPVLEAMQTHQLPLLVHGEVTHPEVDVFDREARFIETVLAPLATRFPELPIVFEHITTAEAVDFVSSARDKLAATITAHHLHLNRNALFDGGLRPHAYCLPVAKREHHRAKLVAAAISGDPRFFLGTDSAPHVRSAKESDCGCAGLYTAHAAVELYAEIFDAHDALDKLEGFASEYGPRFYGLAANSAHLRLRRAAWQVEPNYAYAGEELVPFRAASEVAWRVEAVG